MQTRPDPLARTEHSAGPQLQRIKARPAGADARSTYLVPLVLRACCRDFIGQHSITEQEKTITIRKLALSALSLKRGPENAPRKTQLVLSDCTTGTIHKSAGSETNGSRICARSIQPAREAIQFCTCQNRSPTELLRLRGLGGPDTSLPRSSRKGGRNARSNQKPKQPSSNLP